MRRHVLLVSWLWVAAGVALGAWASWGLATEGWEFQSVVVSWFITLSFALLAVAAGLAFLRGGALGRVLVRLVSSLALLYSAAWLLLGGVEDAGNYWPGITLGVTMSVYAFVVSRRQASAA